MHVCSGELIKRLSEKPPLLAGDRCVVENQWRIKKGEMKTGGLYDHRLISYMSSLRGV